MSATLRALAVCVALLATRDTHAQSPPAGPDGSGTLAGTVSDSAGMGIVGATVFVIGGSTVAISADDGAFRLANIASGMRTIVARRIGFRPESVSVMVAGDSAIRVRMRLESTAQQVAPVLVTSGRGQYTGRLRGFNERRDRGIGRFFTASDIVTRRPQRVTDLLRTVPGARLQNVNGQTVVTFRGMRCAPLVWVDGTPATVGYLDVDNFAPHSLAGIEVYPGPATVPSVFHWVRGKADCGVIALWTALPEGGGRRVKPLSVKDIEALLLSSQIFTADLVDTPASPDSARPLAPVFPDSLMRAAVGGRVVAEFVVEINGEPNMATFSAVQSTHAMFTEAVRGALSATRFTPAWRGGKRVRQLVQLPFSFSIPESRGR